MFTVFYLRNSVFLRVIISYYITYVQGDSTLHSDPRYFPRPRIGDYYPPAQVAQPRLQYSFMIGLHLFT